MLVQKEKNTPSKLTHNGLQKNNASSWVEIDKAAFEYNIASYKKVVNPAMLLTVIKSNAYGHGIASIAAICDQNAAVNMIGVVSVHEALLLRSLGIKKPLLVISILDGNWEDAVAQNIDLVAYDMDTIEHLNALGKMLNKKVQIHLKIDTGLSRLGLHVADALDTIQRIHELPFTTLRGIFTHLAESESIDQTFTNHQIKQFDALLAQVEAMNITIPLKHSSCSAAATANKNSHFTLARVGVGLYGLWPSDDNKKMATQAYPGFSLKPVLTWKTRIIQIKEIPAESYIGYDRTHQVRRHTRIAILPVGYWDGYDRQLSNKGTVLINNQRAPIVGRIAMNMCTVDITNLDVSMHDEVTLLGNHSGLTADDIAGHCQTINYEIVTRINPLLPRIVV